MTLVAEQSEADVLVEFVDNRLDDGSLPEVLAFVCDEKTSGVFVDYFAKRGLASRVGPGGIAGAAAYLSDNPPPSLLAVDLSASTDRASDIEGLADVCEPGTTVIAVGAENDIQLYRDLLEAGFADYLVKPLTQEILHSAIERVMRQADGEESDAKSGEVVIVIGSRGGAGASTVAVNSAWQMANQKQKKVVLVDLDLQFGTASLALDTEPGRGLREMLENPSRVDSLFIASAAANVGTNLNVLGCEEGLSEDLDFGAEALELLVDELRRNFDYVIIDMPRSVAVHHREALPLASSVCVVSDLSLAGMRDTLRLLQFAKSAGPKARQLVVANRVGGDKKNDLPRAEFERGIEAKVTNLIPDDLKAAKAANNSGKPIQVSAKGSKMVTAINKLCDTLEKQSNEAAKGKGKAKAKGKGKGKDGASDKAEGKKSILERLWSKS